MAAGSGLGLGDGGFVTRRRPTAPHRSVRRQHAVQSLEAMKVFKFMSFDCKIIMSLNTVPTDYHEFEYSKLSVFKLKFMTTGCIHAER